MKLTHRDLIGLLAYRVKTKRPEIEHELALYVRQAYDIVEYLKTNDHKAFVAMSDEELAEAILSYQGIEILESESPTINELEKIIKEVLDVFSDL